MNDTESNDTRPEGSPRESAQITTTVIPTSRIHPNDYNPNRMTDAEFAELVAEVRHLGRLPKPVVVRPNEDGYQIVDGEHGWRVAQEVGLPEIACEVIEADDFEAMRQTYKRNQHGTHNPVLQGRVFRQMLIRNADFLSSEERAGLWMLRPGEGVPDDVFRRAQLKTIETLRTRHEFLTGQTVPETVAQLEAMWQGESIKDILDGHIGEMLREIDVEASHALFDDRAEDERRALLRRKSR